MGYSSLLDISLNVDYSELEEKLERIDSNVETLVEKVKDIEDGGYPVDEDKVNDIIATYVSDEGIITEQGIDGKLRDYVSNDDLDSLVDDYLSNNEYMTSDDFEQKVRDLAHEEGVLTGDNLESSTPFSDLAQRVEALENDELGNQVGTLANEAVSLTERVNALEQSADSQEDVLLNDHTTRIGALEDQVKAMDSALDSQLRRIADLEALAEEQRDNNDTAMSFFKLIKQAFALLQRGA